MEEVGFEELYQEEDEEEINENAFNDDEDVDPEEEDEDIYVDFVDPEKVKNLSKKRIGSHLCVIITRNEKDILPDLSKTNLPILLEYVDSKFTHPYFTRFEKAKALARRVKKIEEGNSITVELNGETSTIDIALKEIKERKCPMYIKRVRNNTDRQYYFIDANAKNSFGKYMFELDFV